MLAMARNKIAAFVLEKRLRLLLKEVVSDDLIAKVKLDVHGTRDGITCHLELTSEDVEQLVRELKEKGIE